MKKEILLTTTALACIALVGCGKKIDDTAKLKETISSLESENKQLKKGENSTSYQDSETAQSNNMIQAFPNSTKNLEEFSTLNLVVKTSLSLLNKEKDDSVLDEVDKDLTKLVDIIKATADEKKKYLSEKNESTMETQIALCDKKVDDTIEKSNEIKKALVPLLEYNRELSDLELAKLSSFLQDISTNYTELIVENEEN